MKYLTFNELIIKLGGRSRASIYRDLVANRIPQPKRIGARVYWLESEVDAFMQKGEISDER